MQTDKELIRVDFEFTAPVTEEELKMQLSGEGSVLMGGGTDLLVKRRIGRVKPERIVSTLGIPSLHRLDFDGRKLVVGANVTHSELLGFGPLKERFPILYDAVYTIGSPQIRNRGTLVGNIVNASPAGDGLLAAYVLGAEVELSDGSVLPVEKFVTGPGKTALRRGRYVRSVILRDEGWDLHRFEKVGQRNAMTISVASVGWVVRMNGEAVEEMRLAFGSVAPTVLRMREIEEFSKGRKIDGAFVEAISKKVFDSVNPINDVRGSALYRKRLCRNLVYRFIE